MQKWNTKVSIFKAHKARVMILDEVNSSFKDQFKTIYDYTHELLRCNHESTVKGKVDDTDG